MIKDENYIHIQGWMINKLNLKGNDLLIYATIFGYSQHDEGFFRGGLQYLADWTNSTKQGVLKNLKSLIEKNLITKQEIVVDGKTYFAYKTVDIESVKQSLPLNRVYQGVKQSLTHHETEFNACVKQSLTNNIKENIKEKTKYKTMQNLGEPASRKTKKEKYIDHVLAILEEYDFNSEVVDLIIKFFEDKLQKGKYEGDGYIRGQFDQLSTINTPAQKASIQKSITNGWNSMYYKQEQKSNWGFTDTASGKDDWKTTEELKEIREKGKATRKYF